MYIRRKVFSVALDENGEERYFSTNEIINEEDYLDEVLYSEDEEEPKKKHTGRKIAGGVAGTAALAGGGIYGASKLGKLLEENAIAEARKVAEDNAGKKLSEKEIMRRLKLGKNSAGGASKQRYEKYVRSKNLQAPAEWIKERAKKGDAWIKANPWKTVGGAAAATALTGGAIYGAKKLKDRKSNKD